MSRDPVWWCPPRIAPPACARVGLPRPPSNARNTIPSRRPLVHRLGLGELVTGQERHPNGVATAQRASGHQRAFAWRAGRDQVQEADRRRDGAGSEADGDVARRRPGTQARQGRQHGPWHRIGEQHGARGDQCALLERCHADDEPGHAEQADHDPERTAGPLEQWPEAQGERTGVGSRASSRGRSSPPRRGANRTTATSNPRRTASRPGSVGGGPSRTAVRSAPDLGRWSLPLGSGRSGSGSRHAAASPPGGPRPCPASDHPGRVPLYSPSSSSSSEAHGMPPLLFTPASFACT